MYLCVFPVWRSLGPTYGHLIAELYAWGAPVWEHPRHTVDVARIEGATIVRTSAPYPDFKVANKGLFIDLPILLVLAICSPGFPWSARARTALLGYLPLGVVHLLGFGLSVHLAYVQSDLTSRGLDPGFLALNVIAPLRRLIYSDLSLALPFLVWGALYVWQANQDAGADRLPGR